MSTTESPDSAAAEQVAINHVITNVAHHVDALDWAALRGLFADEVEIDYTSLLGGAVTTIQADALLEIWQSLLPGFAATQHLLGPIAVTLNGERATAQAHVRAYHYLPDVSGGELWMIAGHYTFRLTRAARQWTITAMRLVVFYQEGNLDLPEIARERVAAARAS